MQKKAPEVRYSLDEMNGRLETIKKGQQNKMQSKRLSKLNAERNNWRKTNKQTKNEAQRPVE